ncbi:MAG: type II toxin-antitoxin system VapC family toxin [Actinomycetota bacterium]|nr:type II toxin-antitoxin system VapC family toxin [Actinomycetota bacterium]
MAGLVVADTDIVIDFLRGRGAGARLLRRLIVDRLLRLTAVTGFELRVGTDFLARRDDILRLFRSRTVPLDLASALRAGAVASALQERGTGIGLADCLQAGICLRHDLPLATRNRKHFERVDGLRLVDIDSA